MQPQNVSSSPAANGNGYRPNPHDYGHWRACPGIEQSAEWTKITAQRRRINQDIFDRGHYCSLVDMAWVLCLLEARIIPADKGARVLGALREQLEEGNAGWGGELAIMARLDYDEDTGSLINLGRTLQEPMARMNMRQQADGAADFIENTKVEAAQRDGVGLRPVGVPRHHRVGILADAPGQ